MWTISLFCRLNGFVNANECNEQMKRFALKYRLYQSKITYTINALKMKPVAHGIRKRIDFKLEKLNNGKSTRSSSKPISHAVNDDESNTFASSIEICCNKPSALGVFRLIQPMFWHVVLLHISLIVSVSVWLALPFPLRRRHAIVAFHSRQIDSSTTSHKEHRCNSKLKWFSPLYDGWYILNGMKVL